MPLPVTSVLTPFVELQRDKEKSMDERSYELRCQRIIDRALIESGMRMREVLKQADPLSSPDLQDLVDAEAKLRKIAAGFKISEQLVTAEVQNLSPAYVAEKDAVRAENRDAAKKDMVKKVTRFITNKYATCQAYATLIRESIAAHKPAAPKIKQAIVNPPVTPTKDDGELMLQSDEPLDLGDGGDLDLDGPGVDGSESDTKIGTQEKK